MAAQPDTIVKRSMNSPLYMIIALCVLFLGSGGLGGWYANVFAPGSWLASAVGFFALPVAFALGLQAWYGLALIGALARLIIGSRRSTLPSIRRQQGLPGAIVFLPISTSFGATAGLVVDLLSSSHSTAVVFLLYWLTGMLHGVAAWRLTRAGILVPPESI